MNKIHSLDKAPKQQKLKTKTNKKSLVTPNFVSACSVCIEQSELGEIVSRTIWEVS